MNGIKLLRREQVYYDDVKVGDEVPPIEKSPYNLGKMALFAAVHGDFCAGHFDYQTAEKRFHLDAPFAYGLQLACYLSQLMTDWIGPNGMLKKFKSQTRAPILDKYVITIKGTVTNKYSEGSENYVECDLWAENQYKTVVAKGNATVILPSRSD